MFAAVLKKAAGENAFVCDVKIAGMQTVCSNTAFESSGINVIPADFLSEHEKYGERYVVVDGIEQICSEAFQQEKLWSDMSVPWARPGRSAPVPDRRAEVKARAMFAAPNHPSVGVGILPECLPQ
jgi:hypothetical protein